MRKNNKKGFTIVELVIVIAVIAILAAVLIPTFAGIVSKANASKALQEAQNAIKVVTAEYAAKGETVSEATIYCYDKAVTESDAKVEYTVSYKNGEIGEVKKQTVDLAAGTIYAAADIIDKTETINTDLGKNIVVVVTK